MYKIQKNLAQKGCNNIFNMSASILFERKKTRLVKLLKRAAM
jgi:hypothetical protein